jgi:hypothetical protein
MSYRKATALYLPSLFVALACAKNEPERAMTPASRPIPLASEQQQPAAPRTQTQTQIPPAGHAEHGATHGATADAQRSTTLIATARCEREVKCNNVGESGEYVTQEDCVVRLEPATRGELDKRDCPSGISEVELRQCTDEIKQMGCDRPVQSIDLVTECGNEELCID